MISKPFGPKTWREIFYISESFLEDLTNFCRVSPPSSSFDSDGQCKRVEVKGGGELYIEEVEKKRKVEK